MLVAPPGYGKTTLARQWLARRPHVWFEANDASGDVVALATDLADVLEATVDSASLAVTRRARLTTHARDDVGVLADLQAKAIQPWPANMWLAIDDYELLTRSDLAEEYIYLLQRLANLRLLVTSRVRPRWAKAKALLYGDVCAIEARDLAMREEEARLVLHGTSAQGAHDISAFDGWPAVVGLASLTDVPCSSSNGFSRPLFQFFAEELFQRASPGLRAALPQLALAPWPEPGPRAHPALGRIVIDHGDMPAQLVSALQSISIGRDENSVGIHPLTTREEQVLELLSRGRTNAEIADELVIAEVTAKVHVRNIIRKLGVRSRTEAVIAVLQQRY